MAKTTPPVKNQITRSNPPARQISDGKNEDRGTQQVQRAEAGGEVALSAEDLALLATDQRAGMENIGMRDMAVPRLKLLQDLSPECKKKMDTYVEGAEPGDFYDSVNDILIKGETGFEAILVAFRSTYLEFIPRPKGGGFVADHGVSPGKLLSSVAKDANTGAQMLPNGNELVLTGEYLTLILDEETGQYRMTLTNMAKTQLQASRQLNTWITTLKVPDGQGGTMTPAMFYRTYKFTSAPMQNKKGDTWMGYHIEPGRVVLGLPEPFDGRQLYLACRDIRKDFDANKIKVQKPEAPSEPATHDADAPM